MPEFPLEHRSIPAADAPEPAPAVVLLHGRGADENDLLAAARELPDDRHVVSVRAPTQLGPGYTWYELDRSGGSLHRSQPDTEDFQRSREKLDATVEAAIERYDLDPDRIGLLGFSQGGVIGMASVLERPDRYAWVTALHAYLPATHHDVERFDAAGRTAFVAAGESDQTIPVERSREAADRLREAGLDVTFRTYPTGHGIGSEELADVTAWVGER